VAVIDLSDAPCVVCAGPSVSHAEILQHFPTAYIHPPAQRDDLYRLRERGARTILLIDGVFAHHLAVPAREAVNVVRDGVTLVGASSMGALRAADCWPVGMVGVGLIFRLFRFGLLQSDDEVAVATNPSDSYSALSVALVNVRYATNRARLAGLIDTAAVAGIRGAAAQMYFADRTWPAILDAAGLLSNRGAVDAFCRSIDLKHRDAVRALRYVRTLCDAQRVLACAMAEVPPPSRHGNAQQRYCGHDRLLGRSQEEASVELWRWLLGSGRYHRYLWSLMIGERDFDGLPVSVEERARALRERCPEAIHRLMGNPGSFAARLWAELDCLDELDAELMRLHAHSALAATAVDAGFSCLPALLERTKGEVALRHGVRHWPELEEKLADGRLFGAIPFNWIEDACDRIAMARTFAVHKGWFD
jgi:hypothetical protein